MPQIAFVLQPPSPGVLQDSAFGLIAGGIRMSRVGWEIELTQRRVARAAVLG